MRTVPVILNGVKVSEFQEEGEPNETTVAALPDGGRLISRRTASGKAQLCARFATGALQVLAQEP